MKIAESLKLVDPSGRENVIIIDEDGTVTSYKLELLEDFQSANKGILDNEGNLKQALTPSVPDYTSTNGQYINENSMSLQSTGWKNADFACTTAKTGPFRRVTTAEGYSRMQALIQLPGKGQGITISSTASSTNGDRAYVYMGQLIKIRS